MSRGGKCSYVNCGNTPAKNRELSFFTYPVKDHERCIQWIVNSGRDDFSELEDNKLKYRMLCSNHFRDSAFTNKFKNKLMPNHPAAVPVPWFETENHSPNSPSAHSEDEADNRVADSCVETGNANQQREVTTREETVEEFNKSFKPLSELNPEEELLNSPTPRKKKLLITLRRSQLLMKKKNNNIFFIKKKQHFPNINSVISSLPKLISGEPLIFINMQLRHQNRSEWTEEEKQMDLSIYYKAPNVYKFMRDRGFKLPCLTLIKKWVNVNNVTPGFSTEVFEKVKLKAKSMTEIEKQCVLLFDEMCLRKSLEYDSKSDLIEGFVDIGPLGRTQKVATHATVFMLSSIGFIGSVFIALSVAKQYISPGVQTAIFFPTPMEI